MRTLIPLAIVMMVTLPFCAKHSDNGTGRTAGADSATDRQENSAAWLARAHKHVQDGWTCLHIEGAPRVRGFQYGYLLGREIKESLRITRAVWEYKSGMDWQWLVAKAGAWCMPKMDDENLEELRGIVEGCGAAGDSTTLEEMIAYNGYVELSGYWWPEQKKTLDIHGPKERKDACSSFIATGHMTRDGTPVLGHNTMCSYVEADCYVILDIQPDKGHRILMQTSPGWIHSGSDFFVTDAGLIGSETTIGAFDGFDETGVPEFLRMRRATQDASDIDQWCDIMKKGNNGGYANAWLLGDIRTNEIARLELGLKYVGFEKTNDGFFVGSNLAENQKILRLETDEHETDIRQSGVARRVRWKELMREHAGKITTDLAKLFESDHFDTYLLRGALDWRGLCAHGDYDSTDTDLPFEPAGTVDAKVVNAKLAREMSFLARWGSGCGRAFDAAGFLKRHPQFDWMHGLLRSRPSHRWTTVSAAACAHRGAQEKM